MVTPILTSDELDRLSGSTLLLKAEHKQRAGAFKFRGAFNRISQIPLHERDRGVVAVSSGNHGAAVARASHLLGLQATIFIPEDAPGVKRRLMEDDGARVETFARATSDREAPARQFASETGAALIHPYEDPLVMTGAGTTALELHRQVGPLDALFVPMGGGGLMAGCASAMTVLDPSCELIGVEPSQADDTRRSFEAGHPVTVESPQTIADGLAVPRPGDNTFSINKELVSDVMTVSEAEIEAAMNLLYDSSGEVVEPSGATALAGVLKRKGDWLRVGVVLSGGNVERSRFPEIFSR